MNVNQSVNVYVDKVSEFCTISPTTFRTKVRSSFIITLGSDEGDSF